MKSNEYSFKSVQYPQIRKSASTTSAPMVNPVLWEKVRQLGFVLQTDVEVLGISSHDSKKLKQAGIVTLEQLGGCDVASILMIPRFGITKATRMKEKVSFQVKDLNIISICFMKAIANPENCLDIAWIAGIGFNF